MKALITGPRTSFGEEFAWLSSEIELETLPRVGDDMILNGGAVYTVESLQWFVNGPTTDDYYAGRDYAEPVEAEAVHVNVRPKGDQPFGDRGALKAELLALLAKADAAGLDDKAALALLRKELS